MTDEERPSPRPFYVLRGHTVGITSICFFEEKGELKLLSTDQDGSVYVWSLRTKRTELRWKAHQRSVLTALRWNDFYVTHGRDDKLHVWKAPPSEHSLVSGTPSLIRTIETNALNFCKAALATGSRKADQNDGLIAVPSSKGSEKLDIYRLESGKRELAGVCGPPSEKRSAMAMAVRFWVDSNGSLRLLSGYEDGAIILFLLYTKDSKMHWQILWTARGHQEPVMDLTVVKNDVGDVQTAYSCGADDLLVQYSLVVLPNTMEDSEQQQTPRTTTSGISELDIAEPRVRSQLVDSTGHAALAADPHNGRLVAVAGWNGQLRLYSSRTLDFIVSFDYHKMSAQALAWSSGDHRPIIAIGGADGRISLWYDPLAPAQSMVQHHSNALV